MNKDTDLIFEAYRKRLIENASFVPSDEDIQAVITKTNSKCTVEAVKAVINRVINLYGATNDEILRDGLYEDILDINNHGVMGGGKRRFSTKDVSTAELAVMLSDKIRMNDQMKERNARGENAEEEKELTMDTLIKAIEEALQPYRHECSVCYLGQVMDRVEEMGFKLWGNGPDRDAFNNVWEEFKSKNAYCYDMNATDSYDSYEEKPPFRDNKIEKNGPGEYLFMEGSGRGPDVYLACEFASEHGYKKLILNGLS